MSTRSPQRSKRGRRGPSEHDEQCALFALFQLHEGRYPELRLAYAVPNGGARHRAVAAKLKAEGVRAGVPDLCLPVPRGDYHGLYIEMKKAKAPPSSIRPEQRAWLDALAEQGHRAVVCRGADEALAETLDYLALPAP